MRGLVPLWRGELPLGVAFWTWAVCWGIAINTATKLGFLVLLSYDRVVPAMLVNYGLTLPFNIVAMVGVWRSATRYPGSSVHADLARGSAIALLGAMSLL